MIKEILRHSYRILGNIKVKLCNKKVKIAPFARVLPKTKFEGYNKIGKRTFFSGKMGRCSYIGADSNLTAEIGRYTSIGDNVRTISAVHPTGTFVSTSPVFYSLLKQCGKTYVSRQKFKEFVKLPDKSVPVIIGNDVHVGTGVSFMGKIIVGDGAIVGANSVVTKNVEPYTIVAGNPARVIRKRFTDEQIDFLLNFKWWEKEEAWLEKNADLFEDITKLMEECE